MTSATISIECGGDGYAVAFASSDRAAVLEFDPADPLGLDRVGPGAIRLIHPATWSRVRVADLAASAPGVALLPAPAAIAAPVAETGAVVLTVHIGENVTEVGIVRDDAILGAAALPIGERDLDAAVGDAVALPARLADREGWDRLTDAGPPDLTQAIHGYDPRDGLPDDWRSRFADAVQIARRELATGDAADVALPGLTRPARLRRFDVDAPMRRVLEPLTALVEGALADADVPVSEVAVTVLAGAAADTPVLAEVVRRATGGDPTVPDEPVFAVARGGLSATIPVGSPLPAIESGAPTSGSPVAPSSFASTPVTRPPIDMLVPSAAPVTAPPAVPRGFDIVATTDVVGVRTAGTATAVAGALFAGALVVAMLFRAADAAPAVFGIVVMIAAAVYGVTIAAVKARAIRLYVDEHHLAVDDGDGSSRWHWDRLHRVAVVGAHLEVRPVGATESRRFGPFDAATVHHIRGAVRFYGHRRW